MFSEHLSPEAKGQVWGNAIGGVCKVWSRCHILKGPASPEGPVVSRQH